jgi:hypothetical protein
MQYRKPQIVDCKKAIEVIQGSQKGSLTPPDANKITVTMAAYEADE